LTTLSKEMDMNFYEESGSHIGSAWCLKQQQQQVKHLSHI